MMQCDAQKMYAMRHMHVHPPLDGFEPSATRIVERNLCRLTRQGSPNQRRHRCSTIELQRRDDMTDEGANNGILIAARAMTDDIDESNQNARSTICANSTHVSLQLVNPTNNKLGAISINHWASCSYTKKRAPATCAIALHCHMLRCSSTFNATIQLDGLCRRRP